MIRVSDLQKSSTFSVIVAKTQIVGKIHSSDADDECDDSTTSAPGSSDGWPDPQVRGRSMQYNPSTRSATLGEAPAQSSLASGLRATATEFIPTSRYAPVAGVTSEEPELTQTSVLPDIYALDAYGIPWFYHMYPVPFPFPQMFANGRSRSPKKFRHKKQRSSVSAPVERLPAQDHILPSIEPQMTAETENATQAWDPSRASSNDKMRVPDAMNHLNSSVSPFATQFDIVSRQAALQSNTNTTQRLSQVDLTNIRNVPPHEPLRRVHGQHYGTMPSRRRNYRQAGNGLYGGRGNVGVPLYATMPFPDPVPPMGRPLESNLGISDAYVSYTIGSQACGTIEIEKAAEYGGEQACNTCEPDH